MTIPCTVHELKGVREGRTEGRTEKVTYRGGRWVPHLKKQEQKQKRNTHKKRKLETNKIVYLQFKEYIIFPGLLFPEFAIAK